MAAFKGHVIQLATNVIGSRTIETLFALYPVKLSRKLKSEFYGKPFTLLMTEVPKTLADVIVHNQSSSITTNTSTSDGTHSNAIKSKKELILDSVRDLIQRFVDKGLLEFRYVHDIIWEYMSQLIRQNSSSSSTSSSSSSEKESIQARIADIMSQLIDSGSKLLVTKNGAKTMMVLINEANAKERKRLMKVSRIVTTKLMVPCMGPCI